MTVTSKQQLLTPTEHSAKESLLEVKWGPEKKIEFQREPNEELGITVVYGRMYTNNQALGSISGLFIKNVSPNSAAGRTGQFQAGDKILEVCGTYVDELSREDAITFMRTVKNPISFVVQSIVPVRKPCFIINGKQEENEPTSEKADIMSNKDLLENNTIPYENTMKPAEEESAPAAVISTDEVEQKEKQTPMEIDSEGSEDEEDEDELESHDIATVKKKFATIENKFEVEIEKGPHGLGLFLAGHRNRNRMAVFVCGVNPNSPVYKTGGIEVGDEILQVNDNIVYGHSHLNASSIIKRTAGPMYKFLVSRRKAAIDEVAVRPVTYFPEVLEEETSQQKYENYPNVKDISIEKGTSTLGIMIIEGKHAELGQGIFISDILEDSPAEKAGLEIGDMILAVNKETLVGCNYDQAIALLKRSEGVVLLTLSAPTKRASTPVPPEAEVSKSPTPLNVSQQPSRAATPVPADPPSTCAIIPGQKTTIEIAMDNKALGLFLVCSKDTTNQNSVFVVDVYTGGSAEKDGRIQIGDEILQANETIFKDVANDVPLQILNQIEPKIKMVILRPQNFKYQTVEVDLAKAPGKGMGLSMLGRKDNKGAFVFEVLEGSNAFNDGRITPGDHLVSVNDINVESLAADEVGAVLKSTAMKATLKLNRYITTAR